MTNITYLLGAGASANTIPVVTTMVGRIREFYEWIDSIRYGTINEFDPEPYRSEAGRLKREHNMRLEHLSNELKWLVNEASNYQTIDTLAKKFFLTDKISLRRLKHALVFYFVLEQLIPTKNKSYFFRGEFMKKNELRYDSFFATLLGKKGEQLIINPQVKVLTWNYDVQIELSLRRFTNLIVEDVKTSYQIYPNRNSLNATKIQYDPSAFTAVKLNGNAMWLTPMINGSDIKDSCFNSDIIQNSELKLLDTILEEYALFRKQKEVITDLDKSLQYLNFSWESDVSFTDKYSTYNEQFGIAESIAQHTEILVVIGYSFPVFNREADKRLLNKMRNLKKIYIQDPNCEIIKDTISNGFDVENNYHSNKKMGEPVILPFQLTKDTNQFLIPYELTL